VPTSTVSFSYSRPRQRQGSIASFTYFQDEQESPEYSDEAIEDVSDDDELFMTNGHDRDLEAGPRSPSRRKSSGRDRDPASEPLLRRFDSTRSDTQEHEEGGSFSQKFYIENEDLTMVVAGFTTSTIGYLAYIVICFMTVGLGYLVLRWFPRWRVNLIGRPTPLKDCTWAVVEVSFEHNRKWSTSPAKNKQNQWGEFTVHNITSEEYGHPMSSVFNRPSKEQLNGHRYDNDADLKELRFLDYRYLRFLFHPGQDKFTLNNDWWDSQWTDVKAMKQGLDSEERDPRDQVFGQNVIEIKQKSIPELLLDEVRNR